ncbi:MAG: TonB family protein [Gammaproteobacteria bacterium]|jgi:protein TonB|nr:TonB family protein [Gammaproteobacteria bacterium]
MNAGIRYAVAVVIAVVVTLVTFYVMHLLISGGGGDREQLEQPPGIRFGPVEIDETVETRDRRRPPPPPPPEEPPPPPEMEIAQMEQQVQEMPQLDMPDLDLSSSGSGPFLGSMNQVDRNQEGDVIPLVRIQPQYPRDAAIAEIEGWVQIEFTIDETGSVRSPRVIDSRPPRVFDRAAIRAILRWKFKPRIVDGQPQPRQATQTIEFTLDDA